MDDSNSYAVNFSNTSYDSNRKTEDIYTYYLTTDYNDLDLDFEVGPRAGENAAFTAGQICGGVNPTGFHGSVKVKIERRRWNGTINCKHNNDETWNGVSEVESQHVSFWPNKIQKSTHEYKMYQQGYLYAKVEFYNGTI